MSAKPQTILHIVYIHGFQGDHTSFQAFPTDLHHALQPLIPHHIELRSILYPTYKSRRPISEATEKFLQWLKTLPTGPIILCGHSMGGLLAAEAATSLRTAVAKRIVALIGCDVPFLGMHPHVVVSGIASLLPHKKKEDGHSAGPHSGSNVGGAGLKTEKEMNDERHVNITSAAPSRSPSPNVSQISLLSRDSQAPSLSSSSSLAPPSIPPRPLSAPIPQASSDTQSHRLSHPPAFISRTLEFFESHTDDRLVHFIAKHRSEPITAATRWVVESLEFGICMFDPKGLRDRYAALERWQGDWISFWTVTVPRDKKGREMGVKENGQIEDVGEGREATVFPGKRLETTSVNDSLSVSQFFSHSQSSTSSLELTVEAAVSGPITKSEDKAIKKQAKLDQKIHEKEMKLLAKADQNRRKAEVDVSKNERNGHSPHHFVLLPSHKPSGVTHCWEQIKVHKAKDEVEAHCGLFMRDVNLQYDAFVRRVAEVTKGWVDKMTI